jgi:hypothetical protein
MKPLKELITSQIPSAVTEISWTPLADGTLIQPTFLLDGRAFIDNKLYDIHENLWVVQPIAEKNTAHPFEGSTTVVFQLTDPERAFHLQTGELLLGSDVGLRDVVHIARIPEVDITDLSTHQLDQVKQALLLP